MLNKRRVLVVIGAWALTSAIGLTSLWAVHAGMGLLIFYALLSWPFVFVETENTFLFIISASALQLVYVVLVDILVRAIRARSGPRTSDADRPLS